MKNILHSDKLIKDLHMSVIIIGDIHGTEYWKTIVKENKKSSEDIVIFLGDYVDSYDISPKKIYKNLKAMQELEGVGNNWADYNILLDMAAYNNEDFKNEYSLKNLFLENTRRSI